MSSQFVLSALGPDRPGVVEQVSSVLSRFGLNLEKSRMSVMGREFSLAVLVRGPRTQVEAFLQDIDKVFTPLELDWVVRPTEASDQRDMEPSLPYFLNVAAIDAVGLVARITAVLAQSRANIEDLETATARAAETGTPVFHLTATAMVPPSTRIETLRSDLYALADELYIDLVFEPA